MPWLSKKQAAWGHSVGAKAIGGPSKVSEWDAATDFKSLPERKKNTMGMRKPPKITKIK